MVSIVRASGRTPLFGRAAFAPILRFAGQGAQKLRREQGIGGKVQRKTENLFFSCPLTPTPYPLQVKAQPLDFLRNHQFIQ
jgi:hypothetical protein